MFVVDTTILAYAADTDAEHHDLCRRRLEEWRRAPDAWYVTWSICYEFLRVVTHPAVLRSPWSAPAALTFVDAVLESPGLTVLRPTGRHPEVA